MSSTVPPTAEVWFLTGSQGLYGPETLDQVASQSRAIADRLSEAGELCVCDIAAVVDMTETSVSHALRLLRTAGDRLAEYWVNSDTLMLLSQLRALG